MGIVLAGFPLMYSLTMVQIILLPNSNVYVSCYFTHNTSALVYKHSCRHEKSSRHIQPHRYNTCGSDKLIENHRY